jgi:hypothetical protein
MRANLVSDIVSVIENELNGYGTTSSLSRRKCKKLEQDSIYDSFLPIILEALSLIGT